MSDKLQSTKAIDGKEVIYVDVDDDITSIIDKVSSSKSKIIALVLPKRCVVLQSAVNMKLLKRSADRADKNLVLVTTEASLLPLAGAAEMLVASTPTSKPSVPNAPKQDESTEPEDAAEPLTIIDNSADTDFDKDAQADTPVGTLSGDDGVDDTIELAAADTAVAAAEPAAEALAAKKVKKDRKLKVPNFNSLKVKLAAGFGALIVIIALWFLATQVLPAATITIKADSSTVTTNANLTLDSKAKKLDLSSGTMPATVQSQQKTASQQVPATGQQNNGDKATGSVTFTYKENGDTPPSMKAGTSIRSSAGKTYILQNSVSTLSWNCSGHLGSQTCTSDPVDITAFAGGTAYNTGGTVSFTTSNGSTGSGSADGGTDDIIKIVSQSDIDGATSKITSSNSDTIKQQLANNLSAKGLLPVGSTFLVGTPTVSSDAKVGDQADNVTVTAVTTYTMMGVDKSDVKAVIMNNVNKQIDTSKQAISNDGVNNAKFTTTQTPTATEASVTMQAKSVAGPELDSDKLKKQFAGQKAGDVRETLKAMPGVTDVDVKFNFFWVNTVPHKANKVTININKTNG